MSVYREDLFVNPFFLAVRKRYPKLYKEVEDFCYILCIPQRRALRGRKISREDVETHILMPSHQEKGKFQTHNAKTVSIHNRAITTRDGFEESREIQILFEELSYNEYDQQFRILCVEGLFEGGHEEEEGGEEPELPPDFSYTECQKYLASFPENFIVLRKIDDLAKTFCRTYILVKGSESHIEDRVRKIVEQATEFLGCANQHLRSLYNANYDDMQQIVESYVLHLLHDKLFSSLKTFKKEEDNHLLYMMRCMKKVPPEAFEISTEFCVDQTPAIQILQTLDSCRCPNDMLLVLKRMKDQITKEIDTHLRSNNSNRTECLSADELFPLMIYVIIQSQSPHLATCAFYMEHFTFVDISASELGYDLVSFQAAIQYLTSTDFERFEGYDGNNDMIPVEKERFKSVPVDPMASSMRDPRLPHAKNNVRTLTDSFPQVRIPRPPSQLLASTSSTPDLSALQERRVSTPSRVPPPLESSVSTPHMEYSPKRE